MEPSWSFEPSTTQINEALNSLIEHFNQKNKTFIIAYVLKEVDENGKTKGYGASIYATESAKKSDEIISYLHAGLEHFKKDCKP